MNLDLELSASPAAVAEARHALDGLADTVPDDRLRDVRLLVSELVTNAVRHAGLKPTDMIRLVVLPRARMLRVEVHDPGGGFEPRPPSPDPQRPSGWGLYLVEELADRWGVDSKRRTSVWFELDLAA